MRPLFVRSRIVAGQNLIAVLDDRRMQRALGHGGFIEVDPGAVRAEIDAGGAHAGNLAQRALVARRARGAVHAADVEGRSFHGEEGPSPIGTGVAVPAGAPGSWELPA